MSRYCLVTCPDCAGTGIGDHVQDEDAPYHYRASCVYCLGQGHLNVQRLNDGSLPDQMREWKSPKLGPVPNNPLRLTYDAKAQAE